MWNPNPKKQDEEESWEVRAFAEDKKNVMGSTWPPRSYICTFCRREFRSAQALSGHMNIHRHDRARLHQSQPSNTTNMAPSLILYHLPCPIDNDNAPFFTHSVSAHAPDYYPSNNNLMMMPTCTPSFDFSVAPTVTGFNGFSSNHFNKVEQHETSCNKNRHEELDLELRL